MSSLWFNQDFYFFSLQKKKGKKESLAAVYSVFPVAVCCS